MTRMLRALPPLLFSAALSAAEPAAAPASEAPSRPINADTAATRPGAGESVDAGEPQGASASDESAATRKANERFKPSEKISEDLSVSFPSDI